MGSDGKTVYPDSYYTEEVLVHLSTLTIKDACVEGRIGYHRLKRLWKEADIVRTPHPCYTGGRKSPVADVTNEQLVAWRKAYNVDEIAKILELKPKTIRELYRKRELKAPEEVDGRVRLPGTKEPVKCDSRGCEKCKWLDECVRRYEQDLPLLAETLTEDDPIYYVKEVWEVVCE